MNRSRWQQTLGIYFFQCILVGAQDQVMHSQIVSLGCWGLSITSRRPELYLHDWEMRIPWKCIFKLTSESIKWLQKRTLLMRSSWTRCYRTRTNVLHCADSGRRTSSFRIRIKSVKREICIERQNCRQILSEIIRQYSDGKSPNLDIQTWRSHIPI